MRSLLLLSILCWQVASAQINRTPVVMELDRLLLESRFEEAVALAASNSATPGEAGLWIACKQVDAMIRLGKTEEAAALVSRLRGSLSPFAASAALALFRGTEGSLHLNQGRFDLAEEDLTVARSEFQKHAGYPIETAQNLSTLAILYLTTGKYAQAEEQALMALRIRQENLPGTHELIAASYNDLGLIYSQTNLDKALDHYDMALAMYEQLHGKEHAKIAIANTNLGVAYRSLELYGDAVNSFETAGKIWDALYTGAHANKAFVMMNLGQTYARMGDEKASLGFYAKALDMYKAVYGTKHPDLAFVNNLIGNVYKDQGRYSDALSHYQDALIANSPAFSSDDIHRNPSSRDYYNGTSSLFSLMLKAQGLESLYTGKTLRQADLDLALSTLQVCDTLIDQLRQRSTAEADKLSLQSLANEVHADGVRISTLLSEVAVKKKPYRESAFYFAEKGKSAVLLEAISDADAKSFASIPVELLEEEKALKSSIALVSQKLAAKPSEEEERYLRDALFQLGQSYSEFTLKLEKGYPDYFDLKFNTASPSVADVQGLLRKDQLLLSYFIDEKNSRIYIFEIAEGRYRIINHALPADFDRYITGFRNSMFFMEDRVYKMTARNLARILLPSGIPASVKSLIILPTGRLGIIPFEALLVDKVDEELKEEFSALPYLVRSYSVQYEFSASLILQKKKKGMNTGIRSAVLCAPVVFPDKDRLRDLPGTRTEVTTIKDMMAGRNIPGDVLLEQRATEEALKSDKMQETSLLHLATHGIVNETHPELSCIYLQPGDAGDDGNLFSGEIFNLKLNADLVTLSACQTGLGKISKGEGVIGLSRALIYAGARNLIVSFWSVADESTAALMTDFYGRLLDSGASDYAESLRQAKLSLMKGTYAAPYYWAPFVLIGF
jgi:tetratricopeptide (TPR) repeat protein